MREYPLIIGKRSESSLPSRSFPQTLSKAFSASREAILIPDRPSVYFRIISFRVNKAWLQDGIEISESGVRRLVNKLIKTRSVAK